MTIFKRDLINRIVAYVLLPLLFSQFLSCINCQQESAPEGHHKKTKVSAQLVISIILLVLFLSSVVAGCLFYALLSAEIEARSPVVLQSRTRQGLGNDIIESFPFFLYSEVKEVKLGDGGVECAICLTEFVDEDTLRLMPPCSHTFHTNCIDVWLSSQTTCPVCRENLSLKLGEGFPYPSMDVETGNETSPDDISLTANNVSCDDTASCTTPRSRSTGLLSNWSMAEILLPRSHSTGHSLVQVGKNLDRFTLQLPEEVQRELVSMNLRRRSHMQLPQARSSRQGYRSGSFGSQRSSFSQERQTFRRALSMSLSFPFQAASVRSKLAKDDLVQETSQAKDKDFGERSFELLMSGKV